MKVAVIGPKYLVRFEPGEILPDALTALAKDRNWSCGSIQAIGAVEDVILGYYDLHKKEYIRIAVEGEVEVVSLSGNLSRLSETPLWHMHILVSDREARVQGGHLFALKVAVTLECWIEIHDRVVNRKMDEHTGLNLLDV
jgi:uncharacterized protein